MALASSGHTKKIGLHISRHGPSNPVSKLLIYCEYNLTTEGLNDLNICKLMGKAFHHKAEIKNNIFPARISTRKRLDPQLNRQNRGYVII